MTTVLLAGGGTAGHVNPLLATAAELASRGFSPVALGTSEGLEADLVPRAGLDLRTIPRAPAPRRPNGDAFAFPMRFRRAIRVAERVLSETEAKAVVGFGGYVSMPAYLAARRRGVPYVVHEANARPGLANRWGARHAAAVAATFPNTALEGAVVTGMPLRRGIVDLARALRAKRAEATRSEARRALDWPEDCEAVLVMGGSLGAARLNAATVEAIPAIVAHGISVIHLTGRGKSEEAERAYGDLPAKHRRQYVVREYERDMNPVFAAVDVVVCRAGASTVAEVSALGLPALYVPLPFGNGEQALNAASSVAAGAATVIEDDQLTAPSLVLRLEQMILDPERRRSLERAARDIGIVDGAERLVDLVEKAIG